MMKKNDGNLKTIIIVVVALVVIAAGSFGGYLLFANNNKKTNNINQMSVNNTNSQQTNNGTSQQQVIVSSKTYSLDEFLLNLADEDGKRFLKAKIVLGYEEKKLDKELESKKPILRDVVIGVLRSKKSVDINPKNINKIKTEIIQKVGSMLEKGKIDSIYFDDLIVQ